MTTHTRTHTLLNFKCQILFIFSSNTNWKKFSCFARVRSCTCECVCVRIRAPCSAHACRHARKHARTLNVPELISNFGIHSIYSARRLARWMHSASKLGGGGEVVAWWIFGLVSHLGRLANLHMCVRVYFQVGQSMLQLHVCAWVKKSCGCVCGGLYSRRAAP